MKTINNTTKQAQHFISAYNFYKNKNTGLSLYQIYTRYSEKKLKAFIYCRNMLNELNGFDACFCGHNTDHFTYAFLFVKDNKTYLAYITHANNYMILYE